MQQRDYYRERSRIYRQIERSRGSKVMAYVTGDRRNMETQIHAEVVDIFADHLDALFPADRITLLLYTQGGSTLAAWSLVNLLRMFCDELEIVIPRKAHSAGTLMCLGANRIVMTKQATLGPIDPSLTSPLGPQIPGAPPAARAPVSVEAIKGYLELVRTDVGVQEQQALAQVVVDLAQKVHPLVLGDIFRARGQIQFLARQLLRHQIQDASAQKSIIDFLCSESGSHDYTVNRRDAAELGLAVEKPDDKLYGLLKRLHATIRDELELDRAFDPSALLTQTNTLGYSCIRCFIESVAGGSDIFVSEGRLTKMQVQVQQGVTQDAINDIRTSEGWRKR